LVTKMESKGAMRVVPSFAFDKTDANGQVAFDFLSFSSGSVPWLSDQSTGGAMLTFSLADEDLRKGLTSILDKSVEFFINAHCRHHISGWHAGGEQPEYNAGNKRNYHAE